MKIKGSLLTSLVLTMSAFALQAQTPTPSSTPGRHPGQPMNAGAPRTFGSPAEAGTASKPGAMGMNQTANLANTSKLRVVSSKEAAKFARKGNPLVKIKPLPAEQKQQVLSSGKTAGASLVIMTDRLAYPYAADNSVVGTEIGFAHATVSYFNATVYSHAQGGEAYITMHPTATGQMYMVDVRMVSSSGVKGFTLNDQPFQPTILGGENHLVFMVLAESTEPITCDIYADHEWTFNGCEITLVK